MLAISDIKESTLEGLKRPDQACQLAVYILEHLRAFNPETAKGTSEILDYYHKLLQKHKEVIFIPDNSIANYLSFMASKDEYSISCNGRRQGYFLNDSSNSIPIEQDTPIERSPLEKEMYPLLVSWLLTEGYDKAADISSHKAMGKWANPDVVGFNIFDLFKNTTLEIVTIEAKRCLTNWRQDIFEAVAHTMFSNRTYFAFLRKESEKVEQRMLVYAQKFGIGLLEIVVPDNFSDGVEGAVLKTNVLLPAPIQQPNLKIQKEFLCNLGIYDYNTYQQFANSDVNGKNLKRK